MTTPSTAFYRIMQVTGCTTQMELADFLGIKQSSISDAIRRQSVPDSWLMALLHKLCLNPDWVLTGTDAQYLAPSATPIRYGTKNHDRTSPMGIIEKVMPLIVAGLAEAKTKHPHLGDSLDHALRAVTAEHREWEAQAMLIEKPDGTIDDTRLEKARAEGLHCIVTHIRLLAGDYVIPTATEEPTS